MSSYNACPNCGRKAKDAIDSNFFPLYVCNKCRELFCHDDDCGGDDEVCPKCGNDDTSRSASDVYA